jgi:hypothetical protein
MNRSKGAAVMMLAGSLVVGGVSGYFLRDYQADNRGRGPSARNERDLRRRVYQDLNLSPVQQAQWDSLIDLRNRMVNDVFAIPRAKAETIRAETREKQRAILSNDQRSRLDSILSNLASMRKSGPDRSKQNLPNSDSNKKTPPPGKNP